MWETASTSTPSTAARRGADARPLLIAHGWPGSILEFDAIIERLAEPEDAGRSRPSMSSRPRCPAMPGPTSRRTRSARAASRRLYDTLMGVLGYDHFIYQGGDWGCVIGGWMGLDSQRITALHINGYGLRSANMAPETPADIAWLQKAMAIRDTETAYLQLQGTKPQSLGFAMMDSPMGVAAWFAEKFVGWSDVPGRFSDPPFSFDQMLTNIMIYLTTRSFLSARPGSIAACSSKAASASPKGRRIEVPTGVASFPHDLLLFPPRPMVERGYNVVHWTDMPRGGHFASLEEPELLLADLRAFVAGL